MKFINKKHNRNSEVNKVGNKQLKCPYCRNIQNWLLPFRDGYCKIC